MADLVRVLVRTNSLLEGWKATAMTRVFLLILSDPHEKLPESKRRARNFLLPPRVRTIWIPNQFTLSVYRPESLFYIESILPPAAGSGGLLLVETMLEERTIKSTHPQHFETSGEGFTHGSHGDYSRLAPIRVLAGWRPSSKARFLR